MNSMSFNGVFSFCEGVLDKIKYYKKKGVARLLVNASSHKRKHPDYEASMTVEACFILPFFLFALLNIISIMDIYRLQGSMSASMHSSARNMAVMAYEYNEISEGDNGFIASTSLTYLYAENAAKRDLGNIYPKNIDWLTSRVLMGDDCIDLVAEYRIRPPIGILGYNTKWMYNRLRTRAWTGYDNAKVSESGDGNEEIVYVAETGTVYHRSRACTYIKLSISCINYSDVDSERNMGGHRYTPCETCGRNAGTKVYITNQGERYHSTLACSRLKRTVCAIPISHVGNKGPCSRCGGR